MIYKVHPSEINEFRCKHQLHYSLSKAHLEENLIYNVKIPRTRIVEAWTWLREEGIENKTYMTRYEVFVKDPEIACLLKLKYA